MVVTTCQQCGVEFKVAPSRIKAGNCKFCSRVCLDNSQRTSITVTCQQCGVEFNTKHAWVKKGNKFCSKVCYGISQTKTRDDEIRICVCEMWQDGIFIRDICKTVNVSTNTVLKIIKSAGLPLRRPVNISRKNLLTTKPVRNLPQSRGPLLRLNLLPRKPVTMKKRKQDVTPTQMGIRAIRHEELTPLQLYRKTIRDQYRNGVTFSELLIRYDLSATLLCEILEVDV